MKKVNKPEDVPVGHHYAIIILKQNSVTIPGDERSRTNPGHGYPEHTVTNNDYDYSITTDRGEWVKEIEALEKRKSFLGSRGFGADSPYVAFEVTAKAVVDISISVGVK
jgi:hypothetical protein